jgi:hypothetical protein
MSRVNKRKIQDCSGLNECRVLSKSRPGLYHVKLGMDSSIKFRQPDDRPFHLKICSPLLRQEVSKPRSRANSSLRRGGCQNDGPAATANGPLTRISEVSPYNLRI